MSDFVERCRAVRLLVLDVDGVLTDGSIVYTAEGTEIKSFHVRDGLGIKLWRKAGWQAGIISGRNSEVVRRRAAELGIAAVVQGAEDKRPALEKLMAEHGVTAGQVCYVGDDLPDVPLIRSVGLGVTVADGCLEARRAARYVTQTAGGRGAAREVVELLLHSQGRWDEIARALGA